jgi:hypothetical protein
MGKRKKIQGNAKGYGAYPSRRRGQRDSLSDLRPAIGEKVPRVPGLPSALAQVHVAPPVPQAGLLRPVPKLYCDPGVEALVTAAPVQQLLHDDRRPICDRPDFFGERLEIGRGPERKEMRQGAGALGNEPLHLVTHATRVHRLDVVGITKITPPKIQWLAITYPNVMFRDYLLHTSLLLRLYSVACYPLILNRSENCGLFKGFRRHSSLERLLRVKGNLCGCDSLRHFAGVERSSGEV